MLFRPGDARTLERRISRRTLANRLASEGRLLTYSRSAAIRGSLRRVLGCGCASTATSPWPTAGVELRHPGHQTRWSRGSRQRRPRMEAALHDGGRTSEHPSCCALPGPDGHDDAQQIRMNASKNNKPAKVKAPAPGSADGDSEPQKLKSVEQNQEVKKIGDRTGEQKRKALKVFSPEVPQKRLRRTAAPDH